MESTADMAAAAPPRTAHRSRVSRNRRGGRGASIGQWAALCAVVAPVVWVMATQRGAFDTGVLVAWWSSIAIFVTLLLVAERVASGSRADVATLVGLSLTAIVANWLLPIAVPGVALTGILLSIVAGGLARLPHIVALPWIGVQSLALVTIYLALWPAPIAWSAGFAYAMLQITVFALFWHVRQEGERRAELEAALRELESTRALLAESVRVAERSQIARDLHDVVGHHLVGLGLKLDAALAEGAASDHVVQSRQLVRLLLADIREVVAELREHGGLDVGAALRGLATDGPGPRVEVRIADDLPPLVGELGVTMLRAAQEAVTNARRHARASRIEIACDGRGLTVRDDGVGGATAIAGHGLESLAGRCRDVGCTLAVDSPRGGGTTVRVTLPIPCDEVVP